MTRLHQIIPLEKSARTAAFQALTEAYHALARSAQLSGISRTYRKKDDDGDDYPPESTRVQIKSDDVVAKLRGVLVRSLDLAATREWANTTAFADVKVGDHVLIERAPVGLLMFLEKHLENLRTFVSKLPTLDPAEKWLWDAENGVWATEPTQTVKTKKVKRTHVLVPATEQHPAQAQPYDEDTVVGYWSTVKFSGAVPPSHVVTLLERVSALQDAVRVARQEANLVEAQDHPVGQAILGYLFAEPQTPSR